MSNFDKYPRWIIFEGQFLPKYAIALDQLNYTQHFPGITEETSQWFWRFSICVGRVRVATSSDIIRHAEAGIDALGKNSKKSIKRIKKVFPDQDESEIIHSMVESLKMMIEIARCSENCKWFAPLIPSDDSYVHIK